MKSWRTASTGGANKTTSARTASASAAGAESTAPTRSARSRVCRRRAFPMTWWPAVRKARAAEPPIRPRPMTAIRAILWEGLRLGVLFRHSGLLPGLYAAFHVVELGETDGGGHLTRDGAALADLAHE